MHNNKRCLRCTVRLTEKPKGKSEIFQLKYVVLILRKSGRSHFATFGGYKSARGDREKGFRNIKMKILLMPCAHFTFIVQRITFTTEKKQYRQWPRLLCAQPMDGFFCPGNHNENLFRTNLLMIEHRAYAQKHRMFESFDLVSHQSFDGF